jgi:hypothetical protein
MTDNMAGSGATVSLRILDVAGQRVDNVAGEMGAVGRGQRRALLALEVIMQDQFLMVPGKDQIDAGPLEISIKKQLRVRDDDCIRGNMRSVNRLDVDVAIGIQPRSVSGKLGIESASIIQKGHRKWLIVI